MGRAAKIKSWKSFPLLSFNKRLSYPLAVDTSKIASIAEITRIGTIETSPHGLSKVTV